MSTADETLRTDLERVLNSRFGDLEAKLLAYAAVKYPYCRVDMLPETLQHEFDQLRTKRSETALRDALIRIDEQTDLFVSRNEDGVAGLIDRVEIGDDDGFVRRLRDIVADGSPPEDTPEVLSRLERHLDRYLQRRTERQVERIPIATTERATETFKSDLDPEKYGSATELCLPTFSFETIPEFVKERIRQWVQNGADVKILIYSEKVGRQLESGRVQKEIRAGARDLSDLKSDLSGAPGRVKYRFITENEHTYFRGLLVRSTDPTECTYRLLVINQHERGVNSPVLRGQGQTTLYEVLDRYFDRAWSAARPPGLRGQLKQNQKLVGLVVALVVFAGGVYSWIAGFVPQRFSEVLVSLMLGIIITLAQQLYVRILE